MVKPLRHRQTKGAATDMFYLTPPRHIVADAVFQEADQPVVVDAADRGSAVIDRRTRLRNSLELTLQQNQAARSAFVLGDNLASSTKSSAPSCSTA